MVAEDVGKELLAASYSTVPQNRRGSNDSAGISSGVRDFLKKTENGDPEEAWARLAEMVRISTDAIFIRNIYGAISVWYGSGFPRLDWLWGPITENVRRNSPTVFHRKGRIVGFRSAGPHRESHCPYSSGVEIGEL